MREHLSNILILLLRTVGLVIRKYVCKCSVRDPEAEALYRGYLSILAPAWLAACWVRGELDKKSREIEF